MYGVVLMMALSGGADMPAWNDAPGEHVAKYGDHGQKAYRCGGRRGGCHGCYGGGYGGYCGGWGYGCYGGGYGYGCCGGYGYGGYGYGSMPYAGGYYGYSPYSGSVYSGYAQYGTPMYSGGMPGDYGYGVRADQAGRRYYDDRNVEQLGAPRAGGPAPATIVVRLPADAKLTIDGSPTTSTDAVRTFISPPLQPGKEYQYTLKAEVMRDGKAVERTRDVTVRAGEPSEVTFDLPSDRGPPR
jgi:uncharacterized protein (TIGR03000 family)